MTASRLRCPLQTIVRKGKAVKYYFSIFMIPLFIVLSLFFSAPVGAGKDAPSPFSEKLTLVAALTCEGIKGNEPQEQSIAFSASIGHIFCFTSFDPVPQNTSVFHNWYFRDKLYSSQKLNLHPPRWSTFSRIRIKVNDRGPWRVEILDEGKRHLKTLRFSIVD